MKSRSSLYGILVAFLIVGCTIDSNGLHITIPGAGPVAPVNPIVNPITSDDLHVLIVEDSTTAGRAKLTSEQDAMLFGHAVRSFLTANCSSKTDAKGVVTPNWRIVDQNLILDGEWVNGLGTGIKPTSLPFVYIKNGDASTGRPLPSPDAFEALVKKYVGTAK